MTMVEQFDSDVANIEPELPVNFVFQGKSYIGLRTATPASLEMADAGFIPKYDTELSVRKSLFIGVNPPAENDPITIDAVNYRVSQKTPTQDGVLLIYKLVQQN